MSSRITGGLARGIQILALPTPTLRPARQKLRSSIFAYLGHHIVAGKRFVDLFAGTGSYGLECFSRGAKGGCFVEKDFDTFLYLNENIRMVCTSMNVSPEACSPAYFDVFHWLDMEDRTGAFDLVFVGAPYPLYRDMDVFLLNRVKVALRRSPQSRLILELPSDMDMPQVSDLHPLRRLGVSQKKINRPSAIIYQWKEFTSDKPL
eukprot:Rmarinus@m.9499